MNTNSILDTTKKVLGIASDYEVFDVDILMHINSSFATLHQLGVGPEDPLIIFDNDALWSEFIEDKKGLESVKSYIWAKVRIAFDPPGTSFALEALEKICNEFEWRLHVLSDGNTNV